MLTLNVSLPEKLKRWIVQQVTIGRYSSASDYFHDLICKDMHHQEQGAEWLANHLKLLTNTPDDKFVSVSAGDIKTKARQNAKAKLAHKETLSMLKILMMGSQQIEAGKFRSADEVFNELDND